MVQFCTVSFLNLIGQLEGVQAGLDWVLGQGLQIWFTQGLPTLHPPCLLLS